MIMVAPIIFFGAVLFTLIVIENLVVVAVKGARGKMIGETPWAAQILCALSWALFYALSYL